MTAYSLSDLLKKSIHRIEYMRHNKNGLSGIPSGFAELDEITSGWQPSDLIIIAARPGMGKTAFALALARNASVNFKKTVAIFSLEMSAMQLMERLISYETETNTVKLRNGDLTDHEWSQIPSKIGGLDMAQIYVDDTPALNLVELRKKCIGLKDENNIELIIIDYLQLIESDKTGSNSTDKADKISAICYSLKELAKELNIPFIVSSQLGRAVEKRGGFKKPILSDLRVFGAIEEYADQVLFIYRPEYYGLTEDEEGNPTDGLAEILIAKNRNGATGTVPLRFINQYAKFTELQKTTN